MTNRICDKCKKILLFTDYNQKKNGEYNRWCNKCLQKTRCQHNRRRSTCKECKGGSICEHNKIRSICKECKGGSICEHNKTRSICKECVGGSLCKHDRERTKCKECKGGSICEHNIIRSICKECKGGSICEHNIIRSICRECGGGSICEHNKNRSTCKDCEGGSFCEHKKRRSLCVECEGGSICEHKKARFQCKICDPNGYFSCIIRNHIRYALSTNKSKSSIEYLGCTVDEFREHIQTQFEPNMTWENYGEWEIDHIIPLKYNSPTLEEIINRLNWKNTQPMWANENHRKGNRYIGKKPIVIFTD